MYDDKLHRDRTELIKEYKKLITWSTHIYFVSPVWWFRMTPKMETFFDEVLTRLVMGVYTFVFGWNLNRWRKTKQFWSVPFVDAKKRAKYLQVVKKDIKKDLK